MFCVVLGVVAVGENSCESYGDASQNPQSTAAVEPFRLKSAAGKKRRFVLTASNGVTPVRRNVKQKCSRQLSMNRRLVVKGFAFRKGYKRAGQTSPVRDVNGSKKKTLEVITLTKDSDALQSTKSGPSHRSKVMSAGRRCQPRKRLSDGAVLTISGVSPNCTRGQELEPQCDKGSLVRMTEAHTRSINAVGNSGDTKVKRGRPRKIHAADACSNDKDVSFVSERESTLNNVKAAGKRKRGRPRKVSERGPSLNSRSPTAVQKCQLQESRLQDTKTVFRRGGRPRRSVDNACLSGSGRNMLAATNFGKWDERKCTGGNEVRMLAGGGHRNGTDGVRSGNVVVGKGGRSRKRASDDIVG